MLRWLPVLVLCAACTGDQLGLFADAQWQVRCPPGLAGCSGSGRAMDIFAAASDPSVNVMCNVDETGGTRFIRFSISQGGNQLAVNGIQVAAGGGPVQGTGCNVTVVDDNTQYVGQCGSAPPSATQPCQITDLTFVTEPNDDPNNEEGDFGPELQLRISCDEITAPQDPISLRRNLRNRNSPTNPASVRLINCLGL